MRVWLICSRRLRLCAHKGLPWCRQRTSTSCATEQLWSTWGALITMQRNHSWTTALWYNSSGVHQVFLLSHHSPAPSCTESWGVGRGQAIQWLVNQSQLSIIDWHQEIAFRNIDNSLSRSTI